MPTPSLILVPARFKTGKLYTPLATTSGGVVLGASGDFNVTRATTATRVNASGLIEVVASGIPRLDYYTSGGTAGCPALLVEPAATNSAWPSEGFSSTTWALAVSASVSGVSSPDGMNTANTFIASTTTDRVRRLVTLTSGTTYTYSLFGKFGALSSGFTMQVFEENATTYGSGVCQAFNLNEGTLGASGSVGAGFTLQSVGMENYGDGWYRCRMTVLMSYTPPALARIGFRIGTQLSGGRPVSVVSGSVSAWGAQLETGSVATSYIPTTTTSATRNADVISLSGAVSGCKGQTEGTIYAEVDLRAFASSAARRIISLRLDGNNVVSLETSAASGSILLNVVSGASNISATATGLTNGIYKIAAAYNNDASGTVVYVNGTLRDTKTSVVPDVRTATIGLGIRSDLSAGTQFNDRIRSAALYTTRLTNAELAALTTL